MRSVVVGGMFLVLYLVLGSSVPADVAVRDDVVFGADVGRVVGDLADPGADHYRTKVHPIFVILFLPVGSAIARLSPTPYGAARWLTAVVGALGVALLYLLLRRLVPVPGAPEMLAAIWGLSASSLVFATVPETFVFSALLLVPTWFLVAGDRPAGVGRWTGALVLGAAVTTTNVLVPLVAHAAEVVAGPRRLRGIARLVVAVGIAGVVLLSLSLVQRALFPSSQPFWDLDEERAYLSRPTLAAAWRALQGVAVDGIVPRAFRTVRGQLVMTPGGSFPGWTKVAAALWVAALAIACVQCTLRWRERTALEVTVACVLAANVALHTVYGNREVFLYSPHWTQALVLLVALGVPRERPRTCLAALAVVLVAVAASSLAFRHDVATALARL